MESVAIQMVQPLLPHGSTDVGYDLSIKHEMPSRLGDQIKFHSRLIAVEGRKLLFAVRITGAGKVIGEGSHGRTIVQVGE